MMDMIDKVARRLYLMRETGHKSWPRLQEDRKEAYRREAREVIKEVSIMTDEMHEAAMGQMTCRRFRWPIDAGWMWTFAYQEAFKAADGKKEEAA